jgi:hypothetical protein
VPVGTYEQWHTVVPPAMTLRAFSFPAQAALLSTTLTNHPGGGSPGYNARFLTTAGSVTFIDDDQFCCGGMDYARPGSWPIGGQYFTPPPPSPRRANGQALASRGSPSPSIGSPDSERERAQRKKGAAARRFNSSPAGEHQ